MTERQSGLTTAQMREAPHGAIFVWVNGNLSYPRHLARSLGREDLQIVPLSWLQERNARTPTTGVVLDHAACMFMNQEHSWAWNEINLRASLRKERA